MPISMMRRVGGAVRGVSKGWLTSLPLQRRPVIPSVTQRRLRGMEMVDSVQSTRLSKVGRQRCGSVFSNARLNVWSAVHLHEQEEEQPVHVHFPRVHDLLIGFAGGWASRSDCSERVGDDLRLRL